MVTVQFSEATLPDVTNIDAVVLFASFESRGVAVARELASAGYRGPVHALYCADAKSESVSDQLATFNSLFPGNVLEHGMSVLDPRPALDFGQFLSRYSSPLVDVTCFTRENLFALLRGWELGISSFPGVVFGYTAATDYGAWLCRDFRIPHNIVGYAGLTDLSSSRPLVCVVGFDADRAQQLIQHLEPTGVTIVLGGNPSREQFEKRNRKAIELLVGQGDFAITQIDVSSPQTATSQLLAILEQVDDPTRTTHLAPFNNKLSCLAVFACWLQRRNIRVWNALPTSYNLSNYSSGAELSKWFAATW